MNGIFRRFSRVFGCAFLVLAACGLCVCAAEIGEDSPPPPSDTFPPDGLTVVLDPGSVSDIVEGIADVLATEPPEDTEPVEQTDPAPYEVVLTPDAVDALAGAVAGALDTPEDAVPFAAVSGLSGGYYFVCDCALGNSVRFWIPADFAVGSIALNNGVLVNMTNSTIYLYCEQYPSYTFMASRFSGFQYRATSGSNYYSLNIHNVTETNISFLDDEPQAVSTNTLLIVLCVIVLLLGLVSSFVRR